MNRCSPDYKKPALPSGASPMVESLSKPEYEVHLDKNTLIPMKDGTEIAADVYRPDAKGSFPAILIYMPYHKDSYHGSAELFGLS